MVRARIDWLAWVLSGLIALSAVSAGLGLGDLGRPFGGFIIVLNYSNQLWYLHDSPPWWPRFPGRGDLILSLDERPVTVDWHRRVWREAAAAGRPTVRVARDYYGTVTAFNAPVVPFTVGLFLDSHGPYLLNGIAALILAVFVYRADPTRRRHRAFALLFGLLGAQQCLIRNGIFADDDFASWLISLLAVVAMMMPIPPACLYFAYHFPETLVLGPRSGRVAILAFRLLCGLMSLSAAAIAVPRLGAWLGFWTPELGVLDTWALQAFSYSFIGAILMTLARCAWTGLRPESAQLTRAQARPLLFALVAITPVFLPQLLRYTGIVLNDGVFWGPWDSRFMYSFLPLACAFIALRYKAFWAVSPRFLVLVSFVASAILASLVDALIRSLGETRFDIQPVWVLAPIFWLGSLLIGWLMTRRGMLGRSVNWEAHGYSDLAAFSRALAAESDITHLAAAVPKILVRNLGFSRAVLWRRQGSNLAPYAWAGWPRDDVPSAAGWDDTLLTQPARHLAWAAEHGLDRVVPLRDPGRREWVGALGVSRRQTEGVFDERDVPLLEQVGQQTILALTVRDQLDVVRQTQAYALTTEERERVRLARELHDTVQQFLGGLVYAAENVRAAAQAGSPGVDTLLEETVQEARHADADLRNILRDLTYEPFRDGLRPALVRLTDSFQHRTGIQVTRVLDPELDAASTLDQRLALYRVIQQTLDNAQLHGRATAATLMVRVESAVIRLRVCDNGRGGPEPSQREDGHFGLHFMAQRLKDLGGGLTVAASDATGWCVEGWVPRVSAEPASRAEPFDH